MKTLKLFMSLFLICEIAKIVFLSHTLVDIIEMVAFSILFVIFIYIMNREVYIDQLTGAYNYKALVSHAKSLKDYTTVIFIDLNKFKPINDLYGHDVGDEVLRGFARDMKRLFGKHVYRKGGDEFIIFVEFDSDINITEKLKHLARFVYCSKRKCIPCEFAYGISTYHKCNDILDVIAQADNAMYRYKIASKNAN